MSQPTQDFVVYACPRCGKRVFTARRHVGRMGACPCCGEEHEVGGIQTAEEGRERRGTPRADAGTARVAVKRRRDASGSEEGAALSGGELLAVGDVSETGLSFLVRGRRDTRRLSGVAPPSLEVGERIGLTLHLPDSAGHARALQAEVRRVVALSHHEKGSFKIGVEFVGLDEVQRAGLRKLVAQLLEREGDG